MIVLHYGHHPGTTGVHLAAATADDPDGVVVVPRGRRAHLRLTDHPGADGYLWVESGTSSYPLDAHEAPFPTGGYLIDAHLHLPTTLLQAALFDVVFVAQRDHLDAVHRVNAKAAWLPLAAPRSFLEGPREPVFEVGFVGQARRGSRRETVLTAMNTRFAMNDWRRPHSVEEMRDVYRRSRVVVNDPANGDVNMRFFEAMACGAAVVSPPLRNGVEELARPGEHYVVADFDDLPSLLETVGGLVRSTCADAVGARARALVAERHTYHHRLTAMRAALLDASLDAPVRGLSRKQRLRHLAALAESIADDRLARHALRVGAVRDGRSLALVVKAIAKSVRRSSAARRAWLQPYHRRPSP